MTFKVYLAGPIAGLNYEGATEWREYVIKRLGITEIRGYSPMRGKGFLKDKGILKAGDKYEANAISTDRGIMTRDHYDCISCDALFVNLLGATQMSLGTAMEIAWAWDHHIPVIAAMEKIGNPHDHPMIREALGYRVDTLDEAIKITRLLLLGPNA